MENRKIRFPAATVLLIAYCIISILRLEPIGSAIREAFRFGFDCNFLERFLVNWLVYGRYIKISVWSILSIILSVLLCVALFTRKRNNWLVAPVAFTTALDLGLLLYYLYLYFVRHFRYRGSLAVAMMDVLAGACTLLLVLCSCEKTIFHLSGKKISTIVKKLWFAPALFCVISAVISFLSVSFSSAPGISDFLKFTLPTMVYAFALLMLGFWLVYPNKKTSSDVVISNEADDTYSNPNYDFDAPDYSPSNTASVQPVAEELMKYKELLDMGAITQEEFDAKKKQLLEM